MIAGEGAISAKILKAILQKCRKCFYNYPTPRCGGIVKRSAQNAGLNPDDFSGHSLRAGFATQAAINMARFDKIMDQGGWKSELTVKRYIRDGNLFRENAASKLGL